MSQFYIWLLCLIESREKNIVEFRDFGQDL